jgi:hypothetical protein
MSLPEPLVRPGSDDVVDDVTDHVHPVVAAVGDRGSEVDHPVRYPG